MKSIYSLRGLNWHSYSMMHMILFLQGVVLKKFDKFTDHFKDEGYIRKKKTKKTAAAVRSDYGATNVERKKERKKEKRKKRKEKKKERKKERKR